MARRIYEIKLRNGYVPALSEAEALEMQSGGSISGCLHEDDVSISICIPEADTVKMFLLAKTMYDTEKFSYQEVAAAVKAVAVELGYFRIAEDVVDMITTWVERFEELPADEFKEWLLG